MRKIILLSFFLLGLTSGCSVLGSEDGLKQQIGAFYYKEPTLKTRLGVLNQNNIDAGSFFKEEISGTLAIQLCSKTVESVTCDQVVYFKQLTPQVTVTQTANGTPKVSATKAVSEVAATTGSPVVNNVLDSVSSTFSTVSHIPWFYFIVTLLSIPLCINFWRRQVRVEGASETFTVEPEIVFLDARKASVKITVILKRGLSPSALTVFKGWDLAKGLYGQVIEGVAQNLAGSMASDKPERFRSFLSRITGKEPMFQLVTRCGALIHSVQVGNVDMSAADQAEAASKGQIMRHAEELNNFAASTKLPPLFAGFLMVAQTIADSMSVGARVASESQAATERREELTPTTGGEATNAPNTR
ncbi:MAG: hypothetical protein NT141_00880 [candidate division WWE3 bacterium]|nr:hypothetical protein [candidate division WWE3 bacterium]